MKKGITIFTPTYNRADCLPKLYQSLIKQTCMDFEWIVVDDGSTDGTWELIELWINQKLISITYVRQQNSGKHCAHNKGVEMANGMLFTCVDSDDYLKESAVQCILNQWKEQHDAIGILNFKVFEDGKAISKINSDITYSTLCEAYRLFGLSGDTMLIFKTAIIKKYKFPQFDNEKFIPEAFLYDQLDQEGKLYIGKEKLYVCEYRRDGYSASIHKFNATNPYGYKTYIEQRLSFDSTIKYKYLDLIRLVSIKKVIHEKLFVNNKENAILCILAYFPGIMRYYVIYRKYA